MNTLAEIVQHVIIIIVITSFLELLLPEGGIKPFVRFAIGLFVIIAVLNPVLSLVFQEHNLEIKWWDAQNMVSSQERIDRDGQQLKGKLVSVGSQNLKEKLEGQINSMAQLVPGVAEVKTSAVLTEEGGLKALSLRIKEEAAELNEAEADLSSDEDRDKSREQIKNKLSDLLSNFYGLQGVKVEFVFEGG